ncbi:MAG: YciI family protein [Pseudomonadales bacterium]
MLYAIISEDVPDSLQLRLQYREAHIARLQSLAAEHRLVLAGPHPAADTDDFKSVGVSGSLIVAAFDSLQQAQAWASEDPYVVNGVHTASVVKPFVRVLP